MSNATPQNTPANPTPPPSVLWLVVLVVCAVGLGVAIELTRVHVGSHTNPDFHSVCEVSDTVNCETVARSRFAVFLGLPVSVWGIVAYLVLGAVAFLGWRSGRKETPALSGVLFAASVGAVATAGLLAFVSHAIIGALCPWCMGLYVVNLTLFGLASALLIKGRVLPHRALWNDATVLWRRKTMLGILVGLPLLVVVGGRLFLPAYWEHLGWSEVPAMDQGEVGDGTHFIGAKDAVVTIVEYSDYQCPFCRQAHKNTRLMMAQHPGKVRLVHRHMPLDHNCNERVNSVIHPRACDFSYAVECAAQQGKFQQMNDAVFAIQDTVPSNDVDVIEVADSLGLDVDALETCMAGDEVKQRIQTDLKLAYGLQISGTPTYFIGNLRYVGGFKPNALARAVKKSSKNSK